VGNILDQIPLSQCHYEKQKNVDNKEGKK
jgi:hypothetical protein